MVYSVAEQSSSLFSARYRWQVIASMTVNIMTLTHGVAVGWFAPTLPVLESEDSPLGRPITIEEASWVGSLIGLGYLGGNIIFGPLLDRLGRKTCLYIVAIPNIIYWILIYTAQDVIYLYVGRFLAGMTAGGCYVVLPIFTAEISDNKIRGSLSSMSMMNISIGITIGFILSSYLTYHVMPCVAIALPIIYLLAVSGLLETPQHLLRKGCNELAEKSYYFYKNLPTTGSDKEPGVQDASQKEFETFKQQVLSSGVKESVTWRDFFNLPTLKAFALVFTLLICNQLSGSFAIFSYAPYVFAEMGSNLEPSTSTIIIGTCQILGNLTTVLLVDRVGRRVLLLTSFAGMGLGELAIALIMNFSKEILTDYNWLSLVLMCWVAFLASVGVIPLIFVIVIEQLPAKIRSIGTSICMATFSVFIFIALKIYPIMISSLGLAATMYITAIVCAIGFTILGLFLPETKGKQLIEH